MSSLHGATHSTLDIFQKFPVLVNYKAGNSQTYYPVSGTNGPILEFAFQTGRNVFTDLRNIDLHLSVKLEKADGSSVGETDVCFVNNILHSLFSNYELTLNNERVETSNGLYAHKAQIITEVSHTTGEKDTFLRCQGYVQENLAGGTKVANRGTAERKAMSEKSVELDLKGKLLVDFFQCQQLLLPEVSVRIKLMRSNSTFCLFTTEDEEYKVTVTRSFLKVKQMTVAEDVHASILNAMQKAPARYNYPHILLKTIMMPIGQNQVITENIFTNEPIRRLVLAMNRNDAFSGTSKTNPFHYQRFGLGKVNIFRGSDQVVGLDTTRDVFSYYDTMESLNIKSDGNGIKLSDFPDHYILVFDLTSTREADSEVYFPDLVGEPLRLELYFEKALEHTVEILLLGEKLSTLLIDSDGHILKDG